MNNAFRLASCIAAICAASVSAQSTEPFSYGPVEVRENGERQSEREPARKADPRQNAMESASNSGFGSSRYSGSVRARQSAPDWRVRGVDVRAQALVSDISVRRDPQTGHFIMPVLMNGVRIPVIIDTGANMTFLSPEAARATGASGRTTGSRRMVGIGGEANLSMTRIERFSVGDRDLGGFEAAISEKGLPYTLLGQSEIRRLGRIVIDGDVLTISPSSR